MASDENLSTDSVNFNLHVATVVAEELSAVTAEMIDAGSAAAEAVQVGTAHDGKRYAKPATEAVLMTAIWRAMLAAKLHDPAG